MVCIRATAPFLGDYLMDFLFGLVIILFGITALLYMIGD